MSALARHRSTPLPARDRSTGVHASPEVSGSNQDRLDAVRGEMGDPGLGGLLEELSDAFGTDLTDVDVHTDGAAGGHGAIAFARGDEVHLPGTFDPSSRDDRRLLGHELAHVVQQRRGRVPSEGGDNEDPELEREATEAGNKAADGGAVHIASGSEGSGPADHALRSVRSRESPGAAPGRGSGTSEAGVESGDRSTGAGPVRQFAKARGWVRTWIHDDVEVQTGITTEEKEDADALLATVRAEIRKWDAAKQDPEMDFDPDVLHNAHRNLRNKWLRAKQGADRLEDYVASELLREGVDHKMQEVRSFHNGSLGSWADLLNLEPIVAQHSYNLKPILNGGGGGGMFGVKGEQLAGWFDVTYTNSVFTDLSWRSHVFIEITSVGLDTGTLMGGDLSASVDVPGGDGCEAGPERRYRPPSWWADQPAGMVSAGGNIVGGQVEYSGKTIYVGEGAQTIYFDHSAELGVKIGTGNMLEEGGVTTPKEMGKKALIPGFNAMVGLRGSCTGDGSVVESSWDLETTEPDEQAPEPDQWVLTHMAKVFFETEVAEVDGDGIDVLNELLERMTAYDREHPGTEFMVKVQGGASRAWDAVQSQIEQAHRAYQAGKISEVEFQTRMLVLEAEREDHNAQLADERALNVVDKLHEGFGNASELNVMKEAIDKSNVDALGDDITRLEQLGTTDESDNMLDRAVRVSVYYRVPGQA